MNNASPTWESRVERTIRDRDFYERIWDSFFRFWHPGDTTAVMVLKRSKSSSRKWEAILCQETAEVPANLEHSCSHVNERTMRHLGGHDLARTMNRQGSGYARQRVGPQLMNCCTPKQVGTREHGKMLKRIQILEDGRVPATEAKNWKIEGQKRRDGRNRGAKRSM